jgi:hypothetical protein
MNLNTRFQFMKGIVLFFPILFILTQAYAQKEYDLLGKGARAAGMGYAFNAVADDATAISWNPAGIMQIKKPEIAFSVNRISTDFSHEIRSDRVYKPVNTIDYIGFVYPLKIKMKDLVFGASFQNKMNYKTFYYPNEEDVEGDYDYNNNLTVNSISLCGAFSLTRFLGIGVSFNKWFSLGNKADEYNYFYTKMIDDSAFAFDKYYENISESFSYTGYNLTGGILVDLTSFHLPLRFAVKYESPFTLKDEYDITGQVKYAYENNIDTVVIEESRGIEKYYFPGIIALGVSYRYGNYLTLACDFDIKPFKNKDYTFEYGWDRNYYTNNQNPPVLDMTDQYQDDYYLLISNANLNQFRIGAEYIFHPKFGFIPLRAGWKNNPTSISSYNENGDPVKQVYAHSINVGTGFTTKHFSIDLAYERYKFERMDGGYWHERVVYHFFNLSVIYYLK